MRKLLKKILQIILKDNPNNLLDLCIIGLGNPGDKHFKTRHNAGYDYLEKLCNDLGVVLAPNKKLDGHYGEAVINDLKIGFLKPNEYINNSGKSVLLVKKYHVKNLTDILVIHDDMDLEPGEVKLKEGGGHGGHNGLKDIIAKAGKDFVRLRFGIGHPPTKQETNAWVIKKTKPTRKTRPRRILCKSRFCQRFYPEKKMANCHERTS
jgi:PTH1 family peptidyl-tRNA hydrolase